MPTTPCNLLAACKVPTDGHVHKTHELVAVSHISAAAPQGASCLIYAGTYTETHHNASQAWACI